MAVLDSHTNELRTLFRSVGEVDAMIAVLSFRLSLPYYCRPAFTSDSRLEMDGIYHPLVSNAVDNGLTITRGCLISGSNASGKSTFAKAVAIGAILAQTVNTCAARRFITRRALVVTSMAVRDDIEAGDSYFVTEIRSMRRILDRVDEGFCLCFIDEILRGTNTTERIAASAATLEFLQKKDCLCIAATHDIELTRMLAHSYDNIHFSESVTEAGVVFDYKLKPGPTRSRNAIALLAQMGFDVYITHQARQLAEGFDKTGQWPLG